MTTRRRDLDRAAPYDWRDPRHWNGGRRRPCRICGQLSFLLDESGLPAHKVCVAAVDRDRHRV